MSVILLNNGRAYDIINTEDNTRTGNFSFVGVGGVITTPTQIGETISAAALRDFDTIYGGENVGILTSRIVLKDMNPYMTIEYNSDGTVKSVGSSSRVDVIHYVPLLENASLDYDKGVKVLYCSYSNVNFAEHGIGVLLRLYNNTNYDYVLIRFTSNGISSGDGVDMHIQLLASIGEVNGVATEQLQGCIYKKGATTASYGTYYPNKEINAYCDFEANNFLDYFDSNNKIKSGYGIFFGSSKGTNNGLLGEIPLPEPPYRDGGTSSTGGGGGTFDDSSDPVDFTPLPALSAVNSGFVGLYNPSLSLLQQFAQYLWSNELNLDTFKKIFGNPIDLIISLTIVPVKPAISTASQLKFGLNNTGIYMPKIDNQFVQFNFGSIDIKEYFGSALDYSPYTKISIYLPYIGLKQLNTDELMGNTVELQYNIDLFTGACVAELKVASAVIYSFNGNIANQIPVSSESFDSFLRAVIGAASAVGIAAATGGAGALAAGGIGAGATAAGTLETAAGAMSVGAATANSVLSMKPDVMHAGNMSSNTGYMANKQPFLLFEYPIQNIPENYEKYSGYPSNITSLLGDLSGYTEVSNIHLDGIPATESELNEIESLLRGGVIL